jgi:hypothetical protein
LAVKDANNPSALLQLNAFMKVSTYEAAHLEAYGPLRLANDANIVQWIGLRTDTALFSVLPINGA